MNNFILIFSFITEKPHHGHGKPHHGHEKPHHGHGYTQNFGEINTDGETYIEQDTFSQNQHAGTGNYIYEMEQNVGDKYSVGMGSIQDSSLYNPHYLRSYPYYPIVYPEYPQYPHQHQGYYRSHGKDKDHDKDEDDDKDKYDRKDERQRK